MQEYAVSKPPTTMWHQEALWFRTPSVFSHEFTSMITTTHIAVFSILGLLASYLLRTRPRFPLPPGPRADPLIGHLRSIPTKDEAKVFHEWAQRYGDVVYIHALGKSIVVVDSVDVAIDLLEKRSAIYSDRGRFTVLNLMGFEVTLGMLPYGQRFRRQRRMLHSPLTSKACFKWQGVQTNSARRLAKAILENSHDYDRLFGWFSTTVIVKVAYGFDIESEEDEYVKLSDTTSLLLSHSGAPGSTLIDLFPILRHFPSWFPGTHYAHFARKWRYVVLRLLDMPYERTLQAMANGDSTPSIVGTYAKRFQDQDVVNEVDVDDVKNVGMVSLTAGAETTWSTLVVFLLAMLQNPDAQKRAQAEIDTVIGTDTLPEFSDRASLPYVECLVQEVLRWYPVVPLGIPHRCMEDNIYGGMFIPKGSLVIANARGMSLRESTYANPTEFNPSRFLPKPEGNGEPFFSSAFGFGRRICPGRHLAYSSVWIVATTILATSNISPAVDGTGKEVKFEPEFMDGITSRPKPFPCSITPRSKHAMKVLAMEHLMPKSPDM
ncbi:hypothetical protein HGRIS_010576 [Hohenbuehelia grisea]|uniref:Cytochrome P450 n=1 Tax=Hohenbuehelia grisea TaxID=104357 RepID=A0ABR3IX99_9AGAR